ncbi:leucyl aminopeptidase [Rothia nasimurium]|uniref:leucyl aminopeptidase n=1 Tax=Rothia nasimurium TaxID=85336 RepID=UPI001F0135E4|nr:leucyl aminopeptidase [Rothia nasimurium]
MSESHDLSFSVSSPNLEDLDVNVLVLGVHSDKEGPFLAAHTLDDETAEGLDAILEDVGVTGAQDELVRLPGFEGVGADVVALIGLGGTKEDEAARLVALRYAAGSAVRQLAGTESVALALGTNSVEELAAVAEGAAYGAFADAQMRVKTAESVKAPVADVTIVTELSSSEAEGALTRALILGEAVDHTRRLVNTPPSHLFPETFAERALARLENLDDVETKVWDYEELLAGGFGGIAGVGQGSERKPRLVEVKYTPAGATKTVALVGKGITFDTGGISLKPAGSMTTMKSDMAGAATVLNVVAAAAELKIPVAVSGYLCLAENMPGGNSIRPEDVLTMRSGHTVEVMNTDAEGRLVMADGLALASEAEPDVILDIATLTGAQLIALGVRTAAVMGAEDVRNQVLDAAKAAGEDYWPMPMPEHLRSSLKSPVADLQNIGSRYGGMLVAGQFLEEFVGEKDGVKIPWAHLDFAGPSFNEEAPYGFTPKEGTGHSVATLIKFIEGYQA